MEQRNPRTQSSDMPSVQQFDDCMNSNILSASKFGWVAIVKRFIEKKVDVNTRDEDGKTPLMLAGANGHCEVVRVLLSNRADVNLADKNGKTLIDVWTPEVYAFSKKELKCRVGLCKGSKTATKCKQKKLIAPLKSGHMDHNSYACDRCENELHWANPSRCGMSEKKVDGGDPCVRINVTKGNKAFLEYVLERKEIHLGCWINLHMKLFDSSESLKNSLIAGIFPASELFECGDVYPFAWFPTDRLFIPLTLISDSGGKINWIFSTATSSAAKKRNASASEKKKPSATKKAKCKNAKQITAKLGDIDLKLKNLQEPPSQRDVSSCPGPIGGSSTDTSGYGSGYPGPIGGSSMGMSGYLGPIGDPSMDMSGYPGPIGGSSMDMSGYPGPIGGSSMDMSDHPGPIGGSSMDMSGYPGPICGSSMDMSGYPGPIGGSSMDTSRNSNCVVGPVLFGGHPGNSAPKIDMQDRSTPGSRYTESFMSNEGSESPKDVGTLLDEIRARKELASNEDQMVIQQQSDTLRQQQPAQQWKLNQKLSHQEERKKERVQRAHVKRTQVPSLIFDKEKQYDELVEQSDFVTVYVAAAERLIKRCDNNFNLLALKTGEVGPIEFASLSDDEKYVKEKVDKLCNIMAEEDDDVADEEIDIMETDEISCVEIYNPAEAIKIPPQKDVSHNFQYFEDQTGVLPAGAREDATKPDQIAAYNALLDLIRSIPPDVHDTIEKLIPALTQLLRIRMIWRALSRKEQEHRTLVQNLLWGGLITIIQKLDKSKIVPKADELMDFSLNVLNFNKAAVHVKTLTAISSLVNCCSAEFEKYMDSIKPILNYQMSKNSEDCQMVAGVVGDICRALGRKILPYCDDLVDLILQNLQNPAMEMAKPYIILCLGDIAFASRGNFRRYRTVMDILVQISQTEFLKSDNYLNQLRQSVLNAFTGILRGLTLDNKGHIFGPFVASTIELVDLVVKDENRSTGVVSAACCVICDLVDTLGSTVKGQVCVPVVHRLLTVALSINDEDVAKNVQFANKALSKFGDWLNVVNKPNWSE